VKKAKKIIPLPFEKQAELALKAAVNGVIEENSRLGLPLYVGDHGRVVELELDDHQRTSRNHPQKRKR
jgi:hypothetical protein